MKKSVKEIISDFDPPLIICVAFAAVLSTASVITVATDLLAFLPETICCILYLCAAVSLTAMVWSIVKYIKSGKPKRKINSVLHKNKLISRLADDIDFRTVTMAYLSFGINAAFGLAKAAAGIYLHSYWLITLAAYYTLLCVIRIFLLHTNSRLVSVKDGKQKPLIEWKAYGICGRLFMLMTAILNCAIVLIVKEGHGFRYEGFLIYAVALYDFYCLISSVVYIANRRKNHTLIIESIKTIKLSTSLVSMLSLQTSMFASFGGDFEFEAKMNIIVGTAVCVLIFLLGLFMAVRAYVNKKRLAES